jgi:hypothetical protein
MASKFTRDLLNFSNDLRVLFLLPFILLIWMTELFDSRLWRYWNMKSLENWRRFRWRWSAYAFALGGWVFAAASAYVLTRLLAR